MADSVPAALRAADINLWKCATKAAQLQTVKPIVSYWCEYWVVNQILAKGLHTGPGNEQVLRYTMGLMDKLEQTKADYADEDAIIDDAAGQAYIEQFAQETLDRAERVVRANKVTQQTATTFDAAATFFHLVNIWGPADQETQQKIKYAKWNAARIAKAIKDGKDPNESNPKPQEVQQPELDPDDPEVRALGNVASASRPVPPRVSVEDVPDPDLKRDAAGVSLPQSPVSAGPSPSDDGDLKLPGVPTDLAPLAGQPGYFDSESMPSPVSPPAHDQHAAPDLPPPPSTWTQPKYSPDLPSAPTDWARGFTPGTDPYHHQQAAAPPAAPPTFGTSRPATAAVASPPIDPPIDSYYSNIAPTAHTAKPAAPPAAPPARYPAPTAYSAKQAAPPKFTPNTVVAVDEAAMVNAQKHAKWAISALNFEDVNTAVRELRKALEVLGAT